MGRIQSTIGLVTGVPIADTVDQLIAVSARPRDLLAARTKELQNQQVAIGELTALTIAVQLASDKLGEESIFDKKNAVSSNPELLGAVVTGEPAAGTYQFTPIRQASSHQVVSRGFASLDEPIGAGALDVGFGGFLDEGLLLDQVNGGAGVQRGSIRITDRSGASQVVDLRYAQTIDDVVEAINGSQNINVSAELDGDSIKLVDRTGQTASNLKVQEIGVGGTAEDLGLSGIDVASDEATVADIVSLFDNLSLRRLNDGNGVSFQPELNDLTIDLADGSQLLVDFQVSGSEEKTLGDVIDTLNAVDPAKLQARVSADGDRLELVDLTVGGGSFQVASANGGSVAEDLGLTGASAGQVISGDRLVSGLKTTLLSSLSGGRGLGALGQVSITDRSGASTTVDLAAAETIEDVVDLLNSAGVAVSASLNSSRSGIQLVDTSGASASNLIIANADTTNTADSLKIAANVDEILVNSGSLGRQFINEGTLLEDLNAGSGVQLGSFLITDSSGAASGLNLGVSGSTTIGDVLNEINGLGIGVEARITEAGDGILLVDTANGAGALEVEEAGSGTAAADLRLLGVGTLADVNGVQTQVIDGGATETASFSGDDTLLEIVEKINSLDAGVVASIINDGSDTPYRLSLASQVPGSEGELRLEEAGFDFGFVDIVKPQDALLSIGSAYGISAGLIASSSSNNFENVIDGVQLTVNGASTEPVSVTISASDDSIVGGVELFVDSYNKLVQKLDELTFFNEADSTTGLLFGTHEALRVETDISSLVSGRFVGAGDISSLEELGISLREDGQLDFDSEELTAKFASSPDAVKEFFTTEDFGFADKLDKLVESLSGEENSLLINRNNALQRKIEESSDRIEFMNGRLERERERLLLDFYRMEESISKLQANISVIESLKSLVVA